MNTGRVLSSAEERWLNDEQKAYLRNNPCAVCLQPDQLPRYALYRTRYGSHTIDNAILVETLYNRRLAELAKAPPYVPAYDDYTDAEDTFIEQNGICSRLD
jgi:hypothetical protein